MKSMFLALLALVLFPAATQAATVYPLDQAEILSGSRFDVKVEFSSRLPDPNAARLTINGLRCRPGTGQTAPIRAR